MSVTGTPKVGQVVLSVRSEAVWRIVEVKRDHVIARQGVSGTGRSTKLSRKSLKTDRYQLLMEAE